jgi:hypothetical protein
MDELDSLLHRQLHMLRLAAASRVDPDERHELEHCMLRLAVWVKVDDAEVAATVAEFLDEAAACFGTMRYAKGAIFSCGWAAEAFHQWFTDREWAEEAIRESDKCAAWYMKTLNSKDTACLPPRS